MESACRLYCFFCIQPTNAPTTTIATTKAARYTVVRDGHGTQKTPLRWYDELHDRHWDPPYPVAQLSSAPSLALPAGASETATHDSGGTHATNVDIVTRE
jgi:hypothetical protein